MRYLRQLADEEGLAQVKDINLGEADELGVPYVVLVDEESLRSGVVRLRDRETAWFEETHVAHVIPRLTLVYRGLEAAEKSAAKMAALGADTDTAKPKKSKRQKKTVVESEDKSEEKRKAKKKQIKKV